MVIDGKEIASEILEDLRKRVGELKKDNITPHLAVILVGDDASSQAYVRQKELKAQQIGVLLTIFRFNTDITEKELVTTIEKLNNDATIHGIIIQRPLPHHINGDTITLATHPSKDVDGFHPESPFDPPVALAVWKILEKIHEHQSDTNDLLSWLQKQSIVLLGKGQTAGKPILSYLLKNSLNPTVIDSKTENRNELIKDAAIIISAIGKPHSLPTHMISPHSSIIGVGMSRREDKKMQADYDQDEIKGKTSFYTPVPGGVGPINVAMLLSNLIKASNPTQS